jgi:aspartate/methionine/tyrosine aminotransferase
LEKNFNRYSFCCTTNKKIEGIGFWETSWSLLHVSKHGRNGLDCRKLSDYLLNNAGVAVLLGTSFGEYGEVYLRLSLTNSVENIKKALDRIVEAVKTL